MTKIDGCISFSPGESYVFREHRKILENNPKRISTIKERYAGELILVPGEYSSKIESYDIFHRTFIRLTF
jgi:hypothetical protein